MLFTIFSVFYVLIAAAMIVLILMQRGDGANAGASFGGGASGTVFGARGAASFLTRTTGVLAALFFILSLGMGIYLSHHGVAPSPKQSLGVMAGVGSSAPATSAPATSAPASAAPVGSAPATSVPVQHSEVPTAPAAAKSAVPAAPKTSAPAKAPASSAPSASH
ncbi:MAG: preprotein translocase subunit SecG [Rhodanobacteraceae bacterium]|nr:MAG: preprotein translocase subunit SecG [Rhodanobacteraceae bacterium]